MPLRAPPPQSLGEIALVLMGIWFVVEALGTIGSFLSILLDANLQQASIVFYLPLAVYGFAGVFLLLFRKRLARELFPDDDRTLEHPDTSELQEFAVSLLGIWIVVEGVLTAASVESTLLTSPDPRGLDALFNTGKPRAMISPEAWTARLPYLVEIFCGVALYATSGRIVRSWKHMRGAGRTR